MSVKRSSIRPARIHFCLYEYFALPTLSDVENTEVVRLARSRGRPSTTPDRGQQRTPATQTMATPIKDNTCTTQAAEYKVTAPDGNPAMPLGPPHNGPAASDERSIGAVPATQVLQSQEKRGMSSTSANGTPAQTVNLEQINTQGSNVIVHTVSDTCLKICLELEQRRHLKLHHNERRFRLLYLKQRRTSMYDEKIP